MRVFVKNLRNKPLMPCSSRKARLLLKEGKAKIVQYNPFTIRLTSATGETIQSISIGIDTGAKYVGVAITSQDKVLVKAEITLRSDIKQLLSARSILRRSRRSRNTRYRRCKFKYKTSRIYSKKKKKFIKRRIGFTSSRKEGWLPPSIQSRVNSTIAWVEKFASLVSSPKIIMELGKFDVQKMVNPDIQGTDYQEGNAFEFWATRYYVFARDKYTCQICKKKGEVLQTHHMLQVKAGGSNRAANLATVHMTCHSDYHEGKVSHVFKKPKSYKETTFMNILRKQIYKQVVEELGCEITYGNVTITNRKILGLEKSHVNDAIAISGITSIKKNKSDILLIHQIRKNKRSLHESTARKGRKEPNCESKRNKKNTISQNGLYLNDKVLGLGRIGFISGFCQGGLYVKNIEGQYITKPDKSYKQITFSDVQRLSFNRNWQFIITNKDAQFIPHLPAASA